MRSKLVSLAARAVAAAARKRAIFCCGVSPGMAPRPRFCIVEDEDGLEGLL